MKRNRVPMDQESKDHHLLDPLGKETNNSPPSSLELFPRAAANKKTNHTDKLLPHDNALLISSSKRHQIIGPILYHTEELLPELEPHIHSYLQVNILAQYLTTESDQVKSNEIWGSKPYTGDSDVVCMICHSGIYTLMRETPNFYLLKVILHILPGASSYESCERHGIKSRIWGPCETSLLPVKVETVSAPDLVTQFRLERRHFHMIERNTAKRNCLFAPVNNATTSHNLSRGKARREKKVSEQIEYMISNALPKTTVLLFNINNEPCFQYSQEMMFDYGVDPMQWTSHRLKKSVLMFESSVRYELSRELPPTDTDARAPMYDTYRWSRVLSPAEKTREWCANHDIPLDEQNVQVLARGLDWSQIVWAEKSVCIKHVEYAIEKLFWIDRHKLPSKEETDNDST